MVGENCSTKRSFPSRSLIRAPRIGNPASVAILSSAMSSRNASIWLSYLVTYGERCTLLAMTVFISRSTPSPVVATVGTIGTPRMSERRSTFRENRFRAWSMKFSATTTLYPSSISWRTSTRFCSRRVASTTAMTQSGLFSNRRSVATFSSSVVPASEYVPGRSNTEMRFPSYVTTPSSKDTVVPG